ncbi:CocE/NonD family hydrolase [Actinomadura vinacea]|uniref:CocE/NonD family hydrolase n=2 Tax=Actinomadura vinacea TaxID=115336 RepID=A0ABP5VCL2_9ACTN
MRNTFKGLPRALHHVAYESGLVVPGADGRAFTADHYFPVDPGDFPTLLVRTPYGRGLPWAALYGLLFAEQGFHVVLQDSRGPLGGPDSWRAEAADGHAAVAWLREQRWFTGVLGTVGPSYMGYTQWALAASPPPELRAMVIQVGLSRPHDLYYTGGAFNLETALVATTMAVHQSRGLGAYLRAAIRAQRRMDKAARDPSIKDAYVSVLGERAAVLEGVLAHPDPADPFWAGTDLTAVADGLRIPTALISGWYDVCLDQTLRQHSRLVRSGAPTSLLVGPWTHTSAFDKGIKDVFADTLGWLNAHLRDDKSGLRPTQVRVWAGDGWRDLTGWPPAGNVRRHVRADGTLGDATSHEPIPLRQDPADPPPALGGPRLGPRAGAKDNRELETRKDVLTFTSEPSTRPFEVLGPVRCEARISADGAGADVFARLCVVDTQGRSTNLCDGLLRLNTAPAGPVDITVPMSATARMIHPGERIRLQLSGAPSPRFARRPAGPSVVSVHRASLVLGSAGD